MLSYHRHHKKYLMDVVESQSSPLFHNVGIDRILELFEFQCPLFNVCDWLSGDG